MRRRYKRTAATSRRRTPYASRVVSNGIFEKGKSTRGAQPISVSTSRAPQHPPIIKCPHHHCSTPPHDVVLPVLPCACPRARASRTAAAPRQALATPPPALRSIHAAAAERPKCSPTARRMKARWWGTDAQPIHITTVDGRPHRTAHRIQCFLVCSFPCFLACTPRCPAPPTSPTLRSGSAAAESSPPASPLLDTTTRQIVFPCVCSQTPRAPATRRRPAASTPPIHPFAGAAKRSGSSPPIHSVCGSSVCGLKSLVTGPAWRTRLRNGVWRSRRPLRRCCCGRSV